MDISAQMLIFATVAERGSMSAAARSMGQTPSTASMDIVVMFAERRNLAPKTRAFIDCLVREFRHAAAGGRDREAIAKPEKTAS